MTKKQFTRCISFFLVLSIMVLGLCDLFELDNTTNSSKRFYTFRALSDNTVDAVIIGTSGTDRYWVSSQAYEDYGITLYPLSTDAFPSWLYINAIEDALSYQEDIDLFLIDMRPFGQDNTDVDTMDVRARRLLDVMSPFSVNRFKAAIKTIEKRREADPANAERFDLSYFLSFIKYHSKWEDDDFLISKNMGAKYHDYMGYFLSAKATILKTKIKPTAYDSTYKQELDKISEESLYELIDYIKENNINALFIDTPQARGKKEMGRANTVYEILENEGMSYISYYSENTANSFIIDLDPNSDFYNNGHVNFYGATKFTDHLAKYIDENYDLPDRRNDENVVSEWGGIHEILLAKIKELEETKK